MTDRSRRFLLRALLPAFLLLALVPACSRNKPGTLLAPTGIRPRPAAWPGSITGQVVYDPVQCPDLGTGPFPPTTVDLFEDTVRVATDTLSNSELEYLFVGVKPGNYRVVAHTRFFRNFTRTGLTVRDYLLDAGNATMRINSDSLATFIQVNGTMPNYGFDPNANFFLYFLENQLGVYTFNNSDYAFAPPPPIPAGTYRLKFFDDLAISDTGMGWGWSATDTLVAPIVNHRTLYSSGHATDIVVRFPTSGVYAFTFDERRQVFTIQLATAPSASAGIARR